MRSGQSGNAGGSFSSQQLDIPPSAICHSTNARLWHSVPTLQRAHYVDASLASLLELKKTTDFTTGSIFSDIRL